MERLYKYRHLLPKLVEVAAKSPMRFRHGAATITRGGVPLTFGHNRGEIHAEADALRKLRKLPWRDEAWGIVVIRVASSGLAESKPCTQCARAIDLLGLKVYHSTKGNEVEVCHA
jgi:hypothetical protein